MKAKRYILALIASFMVLASCAIDGPGNEASPADGQTAVFTFTPNIGDMVRTKAMSQNPVDPSDGTGSSIKNIYFAVFDGTGSKLSEYAEAVPNTFATENGVEYSYSVKLTVTDEKRIIHVIANGPERLNYGSEAEVIGSLYTYLDAPETGSHDRQDAYWDRIVLENGVQAEPDIDLKDTSPAEYASKYDAYTDVVRTLSSIRLTRNFAQFTIDNTAPDFEVIGFLPINVPDRGSVAPYNRDENRFQDNYGQWTTIASMMGDASGEGNYHGFTSAGTVFVNYSDLDEAELQDMLVDPLGSAFCYEREMPKKDPVYIIVAGSYNGHAVSYYKLELRDGEGQYFPVLRNFRYRINIENVSRDGASTIKEALSSAGTGSDISTSIDLSDLTNISNGEAQLFVSETDVVLVGAEDADDEDALETDDQKVYLQYMFIPDVTAAVQTPANITKEQWIVNWLAKPANAGRTEEEAEAALLSGSEPYVTITRTTETGSTAVFKTAGIVPDNDDDSDTGYRRLTLTPFAPQAVIKAETLTIAGHYKKDGEWREISRQVTYHLRNMLDMTLSCSPAKIPNTAGEEVDVIIGIEAGLPSAIFSLDMNIEAKGLSLSPNNDPLPVNTAYSTIPEKSGVPSFYYTRTIPWSEYLAAPIVSTPEGDFKYFTCHFKTNQAVSSSDDIYVSNKYYNQSMVAFSTFTPQDFSNLTLMSSRVGESKTFSYTMSAVPVDGKVRVGLDGYEPSSTESDLTYVETVTEGGIRYEVYEMSVSSATGNNCDITSYREGKGHVKLWAEGFRPAVTEAIILSEDNYILYVNADGTGEGTRLVVPKGTDVTELSEIVEGQTATLTFYVNKDEVGSKTVKVNGSTVNKASSTAVNLYGVSYYRYTMTYKSAIGDYGMKEMKVSIGDTPVGTFEIPVWKVQEGTELSEVSFDTSKYYLIRNHSSNNYLYNRNNTDSNTSILKAALDYYCLIQFGNTKSTSSIIFIKDGTQYYLGSSGKISTSSSNWNIATRNLMFRFYRNNDGTSYLYDNSSKTAMSTSSATNDNRHWHIINAKLVDPRDKQ